MKALRNTAIIGLISIVLFLFGCTVAPKPKLKQSYESIDSPVMEAISEAVYEVVVPKPTKDSLQYEKPLPLDLLPYDVRTDKYYSIGTAFAIDASRFVSAAHVMHIGTGSQFKEVFLRDNNGKIYSIDKIYKYSSNGDFVVFSLRDAKAKIALIVNTKPRLNQKVYAVGNALGQGIVMRDGLYTSNTAEEEAGAWEWIRFSAAASPGNSGGPLIDQNGKVIGIVRGKSPNENLNYAVPMSEVVNASEDKSIVQMKVIYSLDNMDITKIGTLKEEISMPKSYDELNREVNVMVDQFSKKLIKELFDENRDAIFPNGKGSVPMLHNNYSAIFPYLIMRDKAGNWDAFQAREIREVDLGNNGNFKYGLLGTTIFMHIRKPDDISLKTIYRDSKAFMDLILKSGEYSRKIGPENIKITSMGNAIEDYPFSDSYGRIWKVRTWLIEYSDLKVVTFSLFVPGGYVVMMRLDKTGRVDSGHLLDLKALADFIYVSYSGTFKDWVEFLSIKELLPSVFSTIDIHIEDNKAFRYTSKRFSLSYGPDVMNISEKDALTLYFSYFQDQGRTVWDVYGISIGEDKFNNSIGSVYREMRPPKELGDQYQTGWEEMAKRRFPYNRSAYFKDGRTQIATTYHKRNVSRKKDPVLPFVFYTVDFSKPGNITQKEMETKLNRLTKGLVVYEKTSNTTPRAIKSESINSGFRTSLIEKYRIMNFE